MSIFNLFGKLLGSNEGKVAEAEVSAPAENNSNQCKETQSSEEIRKSLEEFIVFVSQSLVDYPDEVTVRTVSGESEDIFTIQIICRQSDRGKIIGKNGKTIMALRSLVSGVAGRVRRARVSVEVLDVEVSADSTAEA